MQDTVEPDHRCGLCKKTFKQKSSLVRHAKRCTLDPIPSVRQKACRNCIAAKARCDLQRPACSRCNSRDNPCVYIRPARTMGEQHPAINSGPLSNANSDSASGGRTLDPRINDTEAVTIADADTNGSTYLDYGTDFTGLSGLGSGIRGCSIPDLFPSGSFHTSDANPSSGSGFPTFYSTSPSTTRTHATPNTQSHGSTSSYAGSLDVQMDLDSNNAEADADLPLVPRANLENVQLVPDEVDSFSGLATTTEATADEEVEPWILALAAKQILPHAPELVEHSMETLFRAFRSWPRMLAKGIQLPPTIHFFQFCDGERDIGGVGTPKHLARCITLCKMWVGQAEDSGQIVQDAVRGEVESILAKYRDLDAPTLLAAMQSLNILLLLLLFPSNRQSGFSVVPGRVFEAVQDVGFYALSTGMVLHEEATHARPPWRVWAHIEAKRRTLVSIYFLHWAYSVYHKTQHFNCLRLGRMLAPGPKYLWQATDEKTWRNLYTRWLAQWDGKELVQAEFFLVEKGPVMDPRVEMWLEDADELGILMMSIMNAAQRDLSKIPNAEANIIG
ncbi:hypothetical protein HD806DRAFT_494690 [Xylariaceae sp. AK1471]|nr:hypothetical protein HD806DRAFT_494690 [Xylariaceae sp. AK1471]